MHRLGSCDTLHILADLYGISRLSASIVVRNTCEGIKKLLGPLVSQRSTLGRMEQIDVEFESLHGIPYILGAMDVGSKGTSWKLTWMLNFFSHYLRSPHLGYK